MAFTVLGAILEKFNTQQAYKQKYPYGMWEGEIPEIDESNNEITVADSKALIAVEHMGEKPIEWSMESGYLVQTDIRFHLLAIGCEVVDRILVPGLRSIFDRRKKQPCSISLSAMPGVAVAPRGNLSEWVNTKISPDPTRSKDNKTVFAAEVDYLFRFTYDLPGSWSD